MSHTYSFSCFSDVEARNNYLCWEQIGGPRGEDAWEAVGIRSSANTAAVARLKNRPSSHESPASMADMETSASMDSSQSAMVPASMDSTMNSSIHPAVPSTNYHHNIIQNSASTYPTTCYPVANALYDPYEDTRYTNNNNHSHTLSHLYNPATNSLNAGMNCPLMAAPAPTLPISNMCSLYDDGRPWSQGSGSSSTSEDLRYDYPGVIQHNTQASLISADTSSIPNINASINGLQGQHSHNMTDPHHQQQLLHQNQISTNSNTNNNSVSTTLSSHTGQSPLTYNIDYYAYEKYYGHDRSIASRDICTDKNTCNVDSYNVKGNTPEQQLLEQQQQRMVMEQYSSSSDKHGSVLSHQSQDITSVQSKMVSDETLNREQKHQTSLSPTNKSCQSNEASVMQNQLAIRSSGQCQGLYGNAFRENQESSASLAKINSTDVDSVTKEGNKQLIDTNQLVILEQNSADITPNNSSSSQNSLVSSRTESVLQSTNPSIKPLPHNPPTVNNDTSPSNECPVISHLNNPSNSVMTTTASPVSGHTNNIANTKQAMQPGYTSVIVDAQQYQHMSQNEYVH